MNLPLLMVVALLVIYGLAVVYSAIQGRSDYTFSRQLMGVVVGVVAMVAISFFQYHNAAKWVIPLLVISVLLNLSPLLPIIGVSSHGARSWVMIFGQQIQPSEFGKITTILMMAALVSSRREILNSVKEYLKCLAILMIPIASIMLQPDLGTSMVVFVIGLVILFIGGANRRFLIITLIVIVILVFGILFLDQFLGAKLGRDVLLKQYQVDRLLVFLNNDRDPGGLGYNLQQAKISIGSGGLLGQGYMSGTQSSLGFLPEAPTDFIFCVLAEEFGFLGSLGLLFLYSLLLGLSLRVAMKADGFGRLIVGGCMGLWIFQIIQNIGMTCGLMPITGIPLPFFSFGSSFMIVNFMAVGLIVSVHAHKMEQESKRLLA